MTLFFCFQSGEKGEVILSFVNIWVLTLIIWDSDLQY